MTESTELNPECGYLNTQQAAIYLGLSIQYLEIARHKGGGPEYIKLPRAIRYTKADLDNWMDARRRRHTSEAA